MCQSLIRSIDWFPVVKRLEQVNLLSGPCWCWKYLEWWFIEIYIFNVKMYNWYVSIQKYCSQYVNHSGSRILCSKHMQISYIDRYFEFHSFAFATSAITWNTANLRFEVLFKTRFWLPVNFSMCRLFANTALLNSGDSFVLTLHKCAYQEPPSSAPEW